MIRLMPTRHILSHIAKWLLVVPKSHPTQFVRLLDLGLILRWTEFPGFGEAFGPGEIKWDIDAGPFLQEMDAFKAKSPDPLVFAEHLSHFSRVSKHHILKFRFCNLSRIFFTMVALFHMI